MATRFKVRSGPARPLPGATSEDSCTHQHPEHPNCASTGSPIQASASASSPFAEPVKRDETSGGLVLVWCHLRLDGCGGLVDPDSGWQGRRRGGPAEPAGTGGVGLLEDQGAAGLDLGGGAVVDGCGGVQADA